MPDIHSIATMANSGLYNYTESKRGKMVHYRKRVEMLDKNCTMEDTVCDS